MISKSEFLKRVDEINFNGITPYTKVETKKGSSAKDWCKDSWNLTTFPNSLKFSELSYGGVQGMSTAANAYLINSICQSLTKEEIYLNIGIWQGYSMCAGLIDTKCKVIGIDNFSQFTRLTTGDPEQVVRTNANKFSNKNWEFHNIDYAKFLDEFDREVSFYFYDGHHDEQYQYDGIKRALPYLKNGAIVLVDDVNWESAYRGTMNALRDNKVKYDIWFEQKTSRNGHPTYWNGMLFLQVFK